MDQPIDPVRLDVALTERLQDYAAARGIDLQEAFETALGLGLELCASESTRLEDRVRALERQLADLQGALAAVGSAVFGVRALLVGWAAREAFDVGELAAELSATGAAEWALSLAAERGMAAADLAAAAPED